VIELNWNEKVTVHDQTSGDAYGGDVLDSGHECDAVVEYGVRFSHGNHQDASQSSTRIYLKSNNWIVSKNYRLEGMIVKVNPFADSDAQEYYRITDCTAGRDVLLNNEIQHVECVVEHATDYSQVSVS
jgi:hypothetical protein